MAASRQSNHEPTVLAWERTGLERYRRPLPCPLKPKRKGRGVRIYNEPESGADHVANLFKSNTREYEPVRWQPPLTIRVVAG
jgi:hypothetical protein